MRPIILHELLAASGSLEAFLGGTNRIQEAQSVDSRIADDGHFITLSMAETDIRQSVSRGPRTLEVNVHKPWDQDRSYESIDFILNLIDTIYLPVENVSGSDNVRVAQIHRLGRSGNQVDEDWRTLTRQATYTVSYDEFGS